MAEPVRARRLTDQEGQRLQQIVRRGKHEPVRVRRAMIIMASAPGTLACRPPSAASEPASAANASNAGAGRNPKPHDQPGEGSWPAH